MSERTSPPHACAHRREASLTATVLACLVLLAGCGGASHAHTTSKSSKTTSTTHTTTTTAPARPLATETYAATGSNDLIHFQVSIYDLRRVGQLLQLDFGIRCLTPSQGCDLSRAFSPSFPIGARQARQTDDYSPAGVDLVDPGNLYEYQTVYDSVGNPDASTFYDVDGTFKDSLIHLEYVRYPAPPAGVGSLDVVFPAGGPLFGHVPITTGPGPTAGGDLVAAQPSPFNGSGITYPVENLLATSGNSTGSDAESPGRATITLRSDVLFHFDKSNLTPRAQTVLHAVAQQIKSRARGTVQVTGYTDSIGTDAVNIPLSFARARSVVSALKPLTPSVAYTYTGEGPADPVAPNTLPDGQDNPAGRALNRRVTISFAATATRPAPPPALAPAASGAGGQTGSMTVRTDLGSTDYEVSDASLTPDGNLVILRMTLTCTRGQGGTCLPETELAGNSATVPPQPIIGNLDQQPQDAYSLGGFYLLDPSSGDELSTLYDTGTQTSLTTTVDEIPAGQSVQAWAFYPAPASGATSLTLVAPGGSPKLAGIPVGG